jgi:general stress protein YciG
MFGHRRALTRLTRTGKSRVRGYRLPLLRARFETVATDDGFNRMNIVNRARHAARLSPVPDATAPGAEQLAEPFCRLLATSKRSRNMANQQNQSGSKSNQGFASKDAEKQREIASKGGQTSHGVGVADVPERAPEAERKVGEASQAGTSNKR